MLSWLIYFFLMIPPVQANYFLIGNGGEGVVQGKDVFCRDLVDYDLQEVAWVGPVADAYFQERLTQWNPLKLSSSDLDVLARKLTDLNKVRKYLGNEILATLIFFNWQLTDQPLSLINPDEGRTLPIDSLRLPIANRYGQSILVHEKHFLRMNSVNRTALILHEAIYALMKIKLFRAHEPRTQNLSATRMIVAGFFDRANINSPHFADVLQIFLNIQASDDFDVPHDESSFYVIELKSPHLPDILQLKIKDNGKALPQYEQSFKRLCRDAFHKNEFYTYNELIIKKEDRRILFARKYKNQNDLDQLALEIKYAGSSDFVRSLLNSERECIPAIKDQLGLQ